MKTPTFLLFGKTKTVILLLTGVFGAALFAFGHGPYELLGLITFAGVGMLCWISMWFYFSEKEEQGRKGRKFIANPRNL